MPDLVRIIRALSKDEGSVSIGELAEMINQDSTVLMRVIAAANTFGYNPTNIEITSVAEAIHTIGFNRVRMLAMSLMLLDHAGRTSTPFEQRHMASVSLCSGFLAQVAAEHAGILNPETAFVCASLRNFGRLLLGTFMTDDFRAAMEASDAGEGDEAYRRIFGLTPFALGYELLKSANLPASILHAVRQHEPSNGSGSGIAWSDKAMHKLASFSLELSDLALNADLNDKAFADRQQVLIKQAAKEFPFLVERAPNILREAEQRLSVLSAAAGTASIGRVSRERLRHRARHTPISGKPEIVIETHPPTYLPPHEAQQKPVFSPLKPGGDASEPRATPTAFLGTRPAFPLAGATEAEAAETAPADPATTRTTPPLPLPAPAIAVPPPRREVTATAIDAVLKTLGDANAAVPNPLPLAMNAVWRTLAPQDMFFCTLDAAGRSFRIVIGKGPISDRLGERTLFNRRDRNAFFLCHERLINLSVRNTEDASIWRHLPEWMHAADSPRAFLALPVHHNRVLQGVLFVGWPTARTEAFDGPDLAPLQRLFELVARHTGLGDRLNAVA